MKKISLLIALILAFSVSIKAQYNTQSEHFNNPELLIGYAQDCANFWTGVEDTLYGGYFTDVSRSGNVLNNNTKGLVSLSRNAYGFSRVFMLTGDTFYLTKANSALNFMAQHLWDSIYGGWFATSSRSGSNPYTGVKKAFDQHYALLGLTAYWEATNDSLYYESLNQGYAFIENALWDDDPVNFGYYDKVSRTGMQGSDKSFNATVDAVTTHLWNLWLLTGETKYYERLLAMQHNMQQHLIPSMREDGIGFAELFNSSWSEKSSERRTIMGHVLKTGWSLARIYRMTGDESALASARLLVDHVLQKGYDHEYGGPYKDYDRFTGEMYMYGAYDTAKAWWQMEQAITSGLLLWETTREVKYLKMADESLKFFMEYFVDPLYGEVYADRSREGGRVAYSGGFWDENKGSQGKAAYHSIETAYYSYLYAKLVLQRDTARLYYHFDPVGFDREIRMNPLAVDFEKFQLAEVINNGEAWTQFDPLARIIYLPAGAGGLFEVGYRMEGLPDQIYEYADNSPFEQLSVYPNPFQQQLILSFTLSQPESVTVKIYNPLGQLIEEINSGNLAAGKHQLSWDKQFADKGLYFYSLEADGAIVTGKVIAN
ncbi:MAG: AGE family epimerase/isomerase [Bacteroidetes bacterium]|jgi:mannobiose 2-epimerase|nr:AGE family epimerase/isomerase [Bacteroidota bacterium]